ncbi:prepilin peptidase [Acetobacterium wieringae]|uniref:Prepilin peptidase n=1 Tax=Acetobacterium wieringae TaxID=52694 RepID=A0A5D0WTH0_9FIRM|nr:A24 family peptidase [Acetobacterium wieringae]TYC87570.1 prepilin peptidase [Acetobacterium wieringae]
MVLLIQFILYLYIFVIGMVIGSFLNVVIYRMPREISVAKGRSFCPNCNAPIKGYHNIPIFSYLWLRGKCADCGGPIAIRYPLVELFSGLLAVLIFAVYGFSFAWLVVFSAGAILICITMIDFDTMTIPNGLIIALMIPALLSFFVFPEVGLLSRVIGIFIISLPMLVLALFIPDAFGGGDIKLMAVAGFMLGWGNTLLAAFIGIILGGVVAVYLLVKKTADKHMAFGPYLCIGIMTGLLFGDIIIYWYLNLFGL